MRQSSVGYKLLIILVAVFALMSIVGSQTYSAQQPIDATFVKQTVNSIINPRLTLTALRGDILTATWFEQATQTRDAVQTATLLAQTVTLTPTLTVTPSATQLPSATVLNFTNTPISATDRFQTIVAEVDRRFTQTKDAQLASTATSGFVNTVNSIILRTLGYTETPSPTVTLTPTPSPTVTPTLSSAPLPTFNPTEQQQTLIAIANTRIKSTAAAQQTNKAQASIDAIVASLSPPSSTPLVASHTSSLDANEMTLSARVFANVTATLAARQAQTATAVFQSAIEQLVNRESTASVATQRALLTAGFAPINVGNVVQIQRVTTLTGHTNEIRALAVGSSGTLFASAGLDNSVRIWNVQDGAPMLTLSGLTDRRAIAFSADTSRLAACSGDGTIRIWEAASGKLLTILRGHIGAVNSIAFSANGQFLASAGDDQTVRLWEARTGTLLQTLRSHRRPVLTVTFSADSRQIASASQDGVIILWEAESGLQLVTMRSSQALVALAFSPNGTLLASGGYDRVTQVWNTSTGVRTKLLTGTPGTIKALAYCLDGSCILVGYGDGRLVSWDVATEKDVTLGKHGNAINALVLSPDGTRIITGSSDDTVVIWGVRSAP